MHRIFTLAVFAALMLIGAGCYPAGAEKGKQAKNEKKHTHDAWWCEEHGVPEHLCSQCSAEVAAKAKKEGKWCKLHDRAEDQCFICDPERYKKFEDMYIAKYGEKPKRPPESEFKQ